MGLGDREEKNDQFQWLSNPTKEHIVLWKRPIQKCFSNFAQHHPVWKVKCLSIEQTNQLWYIHTIENHPAKRTQWKKKKGQLYIKEYKCVVLFIWSSRIGKTDLKWKKYISEMRLTHYELWVWCTHIFSLSLCTDLRGIDGVILEYKENVLVVWH